MSITIDKPILSLTQAGAALGIDRRTVADLCRVLGIVPTVIGAAKGLTPGQIEKIRKVLKLRS